MQQFLIIQLARFGDVIQTKRLIKSLEKRGQVHICLDAALAPMAALIYAKAILHSVPAHVLPNNNDSRQVHVLYSTIEALKHIDFCAVYNLNYSQLNTALVRIFPPEIIEGYSIKDGQLLRSAWVQKAFLWTQERHISPINLVDFWAHFDTNPCQPTEVNPVATGGGRGLGVVLAGRESRRSLPMSVLAQVVRTYYEALAGAKSGLKIYLLGSSAEVPLARQLMRLLPPAIQSITEDLSGKTSWHGLIEALTGLDMLISPDTGTMHLAAHLGVPVEAFFLSSAWCHETGPYGEGHRVWQSLCACAPCLESAPCLIHTKCLEDFTQRSFYRTLTAHLQNRELMAKESVQESTLTYQASRVDALGSTWKIVYGKDNHAEKRAHLRAVVAEYCKRPLAELVGNCNAAMTQSFYEEADWMLRDKHPNFTALMQEDTNI